MHTTSHYSNRDLDASLMVRRLAAYRNVTTQQAKDEVQRLTQARTEEVNNYYDTRKTEYALGELQLLLRDRELWSDYCFDDCSHWVALV